MSTFRRFRPDDLDKFSKCNLDPLTETYDLNFYLQYHAKWPSLFQVCEDLEGNIVGYSKRIQSNPLKLPTNRARIKSHGESRI